MINKFGREVSPCLFCREPCHHPVATQCDGCHEVTVRLEDFLRTGAAARAFTLRLLAEQAEAEAKAAR